MLMKTVMTMMKMMATTTTMMMKMMMVIVMVMMMVMTMMMMMIQMVMMIAMMVMVIVVMVMTTRMMMVMMMMMMMVMMIGMMEMTTTTMTHNAYLKIILKNHLHSLSKSFNTGRYRQNIRPNAEKMGKNYIKWVKKHKTKIGAFGNNYRRYSIVYAMFATLFLWQHHVIRTPIQNPLSQPQSRPLLSSLFSSTLAVNFIVDVKGVDAKRCSPRGKNINNPHLLPKLSTLKVSTSL